MEGNTHYNQCRTNNNTRNGSASQMGELFRECLFNLGIMSTSKLDPSSLGSSFLFHGLFGLYDLFGTSPVLKSTANHSFHPGHILFYKVNIFLTIAFLDLFLYPSRGILAFHCSFPFLHMLRNTVLAFSFSMGAYIIFPI